MIRTPGEWGTLEWLRSQSGKITESDAPALAGAPRTQTWTKIAERLFLDREGVGTPPEELERWLRLRTVWRSEIQAGIDYYAGLTKAHSGIYQRLPGFCLSLEHTWLGCSPHAITPETVLLVRPHRLRAAFDSQRHAIVSRPVRARAMVCLFVAQKPYADIVDVWDPGLGPEYRAFHRRRVDFDPDWVEETWLPACKWIWQDVRRLIAEAYGGASDN